MNRPSRIEAEITQRTVLAETLRLAVPLWMWELRNCAPWRLQELAVETADAVAAHGDDLQYGGKRCAPTFNALAKGLAVAALTADGGIDYLDLHWCADPGCRATSRFDHANNTPAPPPQAPQPRRPVEALPDIAAWRPPAA